MKTAPYNQDEKSAFEAISIAQKIAFAPMLFQAAIALRDFKILDALDNKKEGLTLNQLTEIIKLSHYSISVLLDMGLSGEIIYQQDERYLLGKVGYFLLHDPMTRVNMDFTQDVCYLGLYDLQDSLKNNKPEGLKVFGEWESIYPALSQLPPNAQKSWFAYDHFYSDAAFNEALDIILEFSPKHIYDVGGNTGKWAITCCQRSDDLEVTIVDLPEQIALAKKNIAQHQLQERIHTHPTNMLENPTLPNEADLWWMSQFLDCFSETQIVEILTLIKSAMKPDSKIAILETFWDRQQYEAAAFSLNASSLYFTAMANGKSRFYHSDTFIEKINEAGLTVIEEKNNIGLGHTLLICEPTK